MRRFIENDLFKQDWRPRSNVELFQYIILKWALAFLIGLFVGITAAFVNLATENIAGWKLFISSKLISQNRYRGDTELFQIFALTCRIEI